jgi:predicted acylesterase/phospholipase RssA
MASARILTFDGGGVRGVIPAVLMQRLSREAGLGDWLGRAEFVAGTSTGGLIALMLAADLDPQAIRELYERRAARVFADSIWDDIVDLGKIRGADYDVENLRREAHAVFGDRRLDQLTKRVLITAFDLDNQDPQSPTWKPKLFHNFAGPDSDGDALAYKVATYTSAAPTYFASDDGYIDGGVFAPNPSMCALAQSQDRRNLPADRPPLSDVRLFSFGTGLSPERVEGDSLDWGYLQWVRPLISLMLEGTNGIAHFQCRQILGDDQYFRLQPSFPPGIAIDQDEVDRIPYMVDFAEQVDIGDAAAWLRAHW